MIIRVVFLSEGEISSTALPLEAVPKRDNDEATVVPFRGSAKPLVFLNLRF